MVRWKDNTVVHRLRTLDYPEQDYYLIFMVGFEMALEKSI